VGRAATSLRRDVKNERYLIGTSKAPRAREQPFNPADLPLTASAKTHPGTCAGHRAPQVPLMCLPRRGRRRIERNVCDHRAQARASNHTACPAEVPGLCVPTGKRHCPTILASGCARCPAKPWRATPCPVPVHRISRSRVLLVRRRDFSSNRADCRAGADWRPKPCSAPSSRCELAAQAMQRAIVQVRIGGPSHAARHRPGANWRA
jgi:hypothetical protein